MIIEFTMKNTRPLADKTPITCCGDFRDEKHWEAFKRVEALRGWRVHESEKVNLVETPNVQGQGEDTSVACGRSPAPGGSAS